MCYNTSLNRSSCHWNLTICKSDTIVQNSAITHNDITVAINLKTGNNTKTV